MTEEHKNLFDEINVIDIHAQTAITELKHLQNEYTLAVEEYFYTLCCTSKGLTDSLFDEKRFSCFDKYEKALPFNIENDVNRSLYRLLNFRDEIDRHIKKFKDFNKALWVIYEEKKKDKE